MNTFPLYTREALDVLKRAYDKAEKEQEKDDHGARNQYPIFPKTFSDDDSSGNDDDGDDDASSSSSSSSFSSEEAEDSSAPESNTQDVTLNNTSNAQASMVKKPGVRKKASARHQISTKQHKQQIQRSKSFVPNIKIPLDNDEELIVPSSLLSREDIQTPGMLPKCRSLVQLATRLGEGRQHVVVLLLRSGRFAGGVFEGAKCIAHRSFQRYTVRKGQGKAQSAQDSQKRAKSMGSQLRRAGEQNLKEDIISVLSEWHHFFETSSLVFISCPNTLKSTLFTPDVKHSITRNDPRIRKIPIDVGRPTYESVLLVHEVMVAVDVGKATPSQEEGGPVLQEETYQQAQDLGVPDNAETLGGHPTAEEQAKSPEVPFGPLHLAAKNGDPMAVLDCLGCNIGLIVDQRAGPDLMTPLHLAAQSTTSTDAAAAASCISALLLQGGADPCVRDGRLRLPYYLATHEKVREAFRMARASLGEDSWDWEDAKVGPPLTEDDLQVRKEKEAEKKRRKKSRQKEKKAKEGAQKKDMEQKQQEEAERRQREEDAKRIRDSLQPKSSNKDNVCDFCQIECKGRKRQQMFKRLEYSYCSTDCVQKHKRELMASAAMARFGN